MSTLITHDRIEQYTQVLDHMLGVVEAQEGHRVRYPDLALVEFISAMADACIMLNCTLDGGPQPNAYEIEAVRQQAACGMGALKVMVALEPGCDTPK